MGIGCFVASPFGFKISRWKNPCEQSYLTIEYHLSFIFASTFLSPLAVYFISFSGFPQQMKNMHGGFISTFVSW
jgi:hypothetical protein